MIEQDTVRLLRECDAGIKMGVSALDEVSGSVSSPTLKKQLGEYRNEHTQMQKELEILLAQYHDDGKEPAMMAKGMSWMKTNIKLGFDESDATVADLITDGCNMGVKSLRRYLNQYQAADEKSKNISKRLIALEERMTREVRPYL